MVRSKLILIGYWSGGEEMEWPDPTSFVDYSWDSDDREEVADYLGRGFVYRAYMGYSTCRFCEKDNGALELSDGVYVWPEGLGHYLTEHGVRLPEPFISHVLSRVQELERSERDSSWWKNQ